MIEFSISKATQSQLYEILLATDILFVPQLSARVNIETYSQKLKLQAENFEAWDNGKLVAVISVYLNDQKKRKGFITNVCVIPQYQKKGIAQKLLEECISFARGRGFESIELEVSEKNIRARDFYMKNGFVLFCSEGDTYRMCLNL